MARKFKINGVERKSNPDKTVIEVSTGNNQYRKEFTVELEGHPDQHTMVNQLKANLEKIDAHLTEQETVTSLVGKNIRIGYDSNDESDDEEEN